MIQKLEYKQKSSLNQEERKCAQYLSPKLDSDLGAVLLSGMSGGSFWG